MELTKQKNGYYYLTAQTPEGIRRISQETKDGLLAQFKKLNENQLFDCFAK